MLPPVADLGSGFTLTFAGFTSEIISARWEGMERTIKGNAYLGTFPSTAPGFSVMQEAREIVLLGHFDPENAPPIAGVAGTFTATWPSTGAGTPAAWPNTGAFSLATWPSTGIDGPTRWEGQATVMSFDVDKKMIFNAIFRLQCEYRVEVSLGLRELSRRRDKRKTDRYDESNSLLYFF